MMQMIEDEESKLFPSDLEQKKKKALLVWAPDMYAFNMMTKIQGQFFNKKFCNVTLISGIDDHQVKAHKQMLSAYSPYFEAMFRGNMREANEDVIILSKIKGIALEKIVLFIYTAAVNIETDTAQDVIVAAKFFQMDMLVDLCSQFIGKHLDIENCLSLAEFSDAYQFEKLYKLSEDFVCKHIMKVREFDEFLQLDAEELCRFIASSELHLPSEEEVFETVMSWVNYDRENREEDIEELLEYIRFPYLGPRFIVRVVEPICESLNLYNLLYRAMKWHFMPNLRYTLKLFRHDLEESRNYMKSIIAINGWENFDRYLRVGLYYNSENDWNYKKWASPKQLRSNCGCTVVNDTLFIAGGILMNGEVTNSVECMDLKTLEWSTLPPMPAKRYSFLMVTLNDCIFVVGGVNRRTNYLRNIDVYNTKTQAWTTLPPTREWSGTKFYCAAGADVVCVSRLLKNTYAYISITYDHSIYYPNTSEWIDSWLTTSGEIVGTGIWVCEPNTFFIVAFRDSIKSYDLANKICKPLFTGSIGEEYTDCKLFGDRLIFYGTNMFIEFNLNSKDWKIMAELNNQNGRVAVVSN